MDRFIQLPSIKRSVISSRPMRWRQSCASHRCWHTTAAEYFYVNISRACFCRVMDNAKLAHRALAGGKRTMVTPSARGRTVKKVIHVINSAWARCRVYGNTPFHGNEHARRVDAAGKARAANNQSDPPFDACAAMSNPIPRPLSSPNQRKTYGVYLSTIATSLPDSTECNDPPT